MNAVGVCHPITSHQKQEEHCALICARALRARARIKPKDKLKKDGIDKFPFKKANDKSLSKNRQLKRLDSMQQNNEKWFYMSRAIHTPETYSKH